MNDRDLALRVAWHYLGTPYIWGGDDPSGFDCSGYIIEILQSVGVLPRTGDWSAAGMYDMFRAGRRDIFSDYTAGDLIFWRARESDAIIHIEMLVDGTRSIGAQGGGSVVTSTVEAWRRNSYIKIRPFASRAFMAGVLNPFHKLEQGGKPNVA